MDDFDRSKQLASSQPIEAVPSPIDIENASSSYDDKVLEALGKQPELRRVYGFWSICGYQVMMMSSWSCIIILYSTVFDLGGPVGLIYGTMIVTIFQCIVMASIAELCSVWPTAGGQQYYTQILAPKRARRFLSYVVGWAVLLGEISNGAGCAVNSANVISAFVELVHPDVEWKTWMTFMVYLVMISIPILVNLAVRILPAVNIFGGFWTVGGIVVWALVSLIKAPKHNAAFVFADFINNSGYTSSGWVFIMSFYTPTYALYGTDAILHLTEEMVDVARTAPRAMVASMGFSGLSTLVAALVLLFCAGDVNSYLSAPEPFINWMIDIWQSFWGAGMFAVIQFCVANLLVVIGTNLTSSRLAWSMARDRAFPGSRYLGHVSTKFQIPLRSMLLILAVEALIGLVIFGGDLAFEAVVSNSSLSYQAGYLIPVALVLFQRKSVLPEDRRFSLGRFGFTLNLLSVMWSSLVIIVFVCPLYVPVNALNIANMNWAIVMLGGELLVATIVWFFYARHHYLLEL